MADRRAAAESAALVPESAVALSSAVLSPLQRILSYVRRFRRAYLIGTAVTLGYALCFQAVPLAVRRVVRLVEDGAAPAAVESAAMALVGVAILFATLRFASRFTLFRAGRAIECELRNDFFAHLQRLPESYFAGQRTGDLMSRAVNDINNVRLFLGMGLLNILQMPVLYLGAIGVMTWVDWRLALAVLLPYPLFIGVARMWGRRMHAASLASQEQLGVMSAAVQENASGVLVVRSYTMEDREEQRFARDNDDLYGKQVELAKVQTGMQATIGLLPAIAQMATLYVGSTLVGAGTLQTADLWMFYVYTLQLTFPTFMMGWVINLTQRGLAGLRRLGDVLDTVPSIRDRDDVAEMESLTGAVDVRELRFAFPGRDDGAALGGITFRAEPGQTVGIVGPVGSGKSTLVAAIPRLLEIEDGSVFIDGIDVNRVPLQLLRSSIAMVPQDSFLFSTSIAENIRFGCPDAVIEEVREAARRAHVCSDIDEFAHGFDTVVGERGVTLSGGQRQRIALARALILDPAILILDDALSSVDAATEEAILKELRGARSGRTCFIVAHRLSAVREADLILVLDEGRIAEAGTHGELVKGEGFYARIHRQQQLESEIEGDVA